VARTERAELPIYRVVAIAVYDFADKLARRVSTDKRGFFNIRVKLPPRSAMRRHPVLPPHLCRDRGFGNANATFETWL
jgi:hypothetical protein